MCLKFTNAPALWYLPIWQQHLDRSIYYIRSAWFLVFCFVDISELNANSVDPDQTPHSAASDLGLHSLPMPLLWDTRLKWVKILSK